MTTHQLQIQLLYPLYDLESMQLLISPSILVSKIIENCITKQIDKYKISPKGYRLYIPEKSQFLHPDLPFLSYFSYFCSEKVSVALLPKYFETVTVYYLTDIIEFQIDPNQTTLAVSRKAAHLLQGRHSTLNSTWKRWSLADKETGEHFQSDQPLSSISTRTFYLRREAHLLETSPIEKDKPVFQGNLFQALARDDFKHDIPIFIQLSLQMIEENFLDIEGIYRKSGLKENIDRMIIPAINLVGSSTYNNLRKFLSRQSVHDITGSIKLYLRQLSEPLIPQYLLDDFRAADQMPPDKKLHRIKLLIRTLPTENYNLIKALGKHFENVTKHQDSNLMGYANLATCLGPCFVRTDGANAVLDTLFSQRLARHLIEHWKYIFLDDKLLIEDSKNATINQDNEELGVKKGDHVSIILINKVAKVKLDNNTEIVISPDQMTYNITEYPEFNEYNEVIKNQEAYPNVKVTCLKPSQSIDSSTGQIILEKNHKLGKLNKKIEALISGSTDEINAKLKTEEGKKLLTQLYYV